MYAKRDVKKEYVKQEEGKKTSLDKEIGEGGATVSDMVQADRDAILDEIDNAVDKGFGSLEFSLNPEEGYFGEQGAAKQDTLDRVGYLMVESNTKKKKKRKKQSKKKRVQSTTTTTQTAPSSGGGAY